MSRLENNKKSMDALVDRGLRFREQGLCIACGADVVEGRLRCEFHLKYFRDRMRAKRRAWAKLGLCVRCGKRQALHGSTHCQVCKDYSIDVRARLPSSLRRRIHHTTLPCNQPGAKRFDDDWNQVTCERCLAIEGLEL